MQFMFQLLYIPIVIYVPALAFSQGESQIKSKIFYACYFLLSIFTFCDFPGSCEKLFWNNNCVSDTNGYNL